MSLKTQIDALVVAVATDQNTQDSKMGNLASLSTTDKASLVAAINEVVASIAAGGGASINDTTASTTSVYSSSKTNDQISAAVTGILNGADAAYDTLKEIQTALEGDDADIASLLTAVGNRVRFDAAQSLTAPQKTQALANIGAVASADVGDTAADFVATYNAARA